MKEFGKLKEFGGIGKTSETVSESELASVWREKVYVCLLILKRVEVPESETIWVEKKKKKIEMRTKI